MFDSVNLITRLSIRKKIQNGIETYFKQTCCMKLPSKQPNTKGGSSQVVSFPSS
jgi:hypothetical protein